jgi:hypothetical protein
MSPASVRPLPNPRRGDSRPRPRSDRRSGDLVTLRSLDASGRSVRHGLRTGALAMSISLFAVPANAQLPRATDCFGWDEAFVAVFHQSLGTTFILSFLLSYLLFGLLARPLASRWWFFTRPGSRIIPIAFTVFAASALVYILGPIWLWGFGRWPYTAVDPWYPLCEYVSTEYSGLLVSLIGRDLAAISQIHFLWAIPALCTLAGAVLALAVTRFWARHSWQKIGRTS